jgi:hypothetical protein
MKQRAASDQQGERPAAIVPPGPRLEERATPYTVLSEDELRVLECLKEAGEGLTVRQLEYRSACSGEALDRALAGLMQQKLVARLNTIVPSYTARLETGGR